MAHRRLAVGIDAVLGSVPLIGDLFDVAWQSNTMNLALLERHGVRVLAVNPGPVETELHINNTKRLAKERFGDENRWRDVMSGLPMKRAATTDEVSGMVAFLCSDYSSYISGSSITIELMVPWGTGLAASSTTSNL